MKEDVKKVKKAVVWSDSERVLLEELWDGERNTALREKVFSHASMRAWWKCSRGHSFAEMPKRVVRGGGCPVCAGRRIIVGVNDFVTMFPVLAREWCVERNGPVPFGLKAGSNRKVWWRCSVGHSWEAVVFERTRNNTGCPVCSNSLIVPGVNDIVSTHPQVAALWDGERNSVGAASVGAGSGKRVWWRCGIGHSFERQVRYMTRMGNVLCPVCSNNLIVSGVNDLGSTHPHVAALWDGERNSVGAASVGAGSGKRVWWRCGVGHSWELPVRRQVKHVGEGKDCPYCSGSRVIPRVTSVDVVYPHLVGEVADAGRLSELSAGSGERLMWKCGKGHVWTARVVDRTYYGSGCPDCAAASWASKGEDEVAGFLAGLGCKVSRAFFLYKGEDAGSSGQGKFCYDILAEHNGRRLVVEYNGLFWHSEQAGRLKGYHEEKAALARASGYDFFTVWEDDWKFKRAIVEGMLAYRVGEATAGKVFARSLVAEQVPFAVAGKFLDAYHIQGAVGGSVILGLVSYSDERGMFFRGSEGEECWLFAVLVGRVEQGGECLNVHRFATCCVVPGGFGKLLAAVKRPGVVGERLTKKLSRVRVVRTFSDGCVSDGELYRGLGFVPVERLGADYSYVVAGRRVHKFSLRKERFRKDETLKFREGLSERELAGLNGFERVWDAGKVRWEKDF